MPRTIVFTDLDASLLDHRTYRWDDAADTIDRLRAADIPLVLASSKTAAEMRTIASEIGTDAPLIFENGGGIDWRDGSVETVATPRQQVLSVLDDARSAGFAFRSFRDLGVGGVAEVTGLDRDRAAAACDRHATEPLLVDEPEDRHEAFEHFIRDAGLTIVRGGRFWHVAGDIDKGRAVSWVIDRCDERPRVICVGDSPNDAGMLDVADVAIVIPGPDGRSKMPTGEGWIIAPQTGPAGWGRAVADAAGVR